MSHGYSRRRFIRSFSAATLVGLGAPAAAEAATASAGATGRSAGAGTAPLAQADDPLGVRADFPAASEGLYLNSPYITPSPHQVVEAGRRFFEAKGRDPIPLGAMLEEADRVREGFGRLIGAGPSEIGILDATSAGENLVARSFELGEGDNVVIDDLHYETTYALYRELARKRGVDLRIVRSGDGAASVEEFAELVDDDTRLVSVAWVSHQNGYRHDLRALADLAHAHGAYLYADAIQGIGMLELDVRETGVDFLAAGTYKWLLGGFGVAAFYVRAELIDRVAPDRMGSLNISRELGDFHYELYDDGRKYLYATPAFGAVYQLGAALDYLHGVGVGNIEAHTVPLAGKLRDGLVTQGHRLLTPPRNHSAIVVFEHEHDPEMARRSLDDAGVRVTLREDGRQIRAGVALFNNADEIDRFLTITDGWA